MVRDAKVTGLLVAVNKTGKSYKVQRDLWQGPRGRRVLVKTVRHTLGGTEEMTLDDARSRALAVLDQIKRGIDPNAPPPDDARAWTGRRMFEEYGADMRARGCVELSVTDMLERLDRYLPKWADMPITEVKRSAVARSPAGSPTNTGPRPRTRPCATSAPPTTAPSRLLTTRTPCRATRWRRSR
ncbi:MAG: integrase arm-type DNA-binding domain-containing protein [Rhodosalinus sp.]